jgi:mono/diheme cytochrome c family protein
MYRFIMLVAALISFVCQQAIAEGDGLDDHGAVVYAGNCVACHQAEGEGIEPVFPALAGNEFVAGDAADVAGIISNGRAAMPAFQQDLSVEDIAAVATYIRQAWGNELPAIDVSTVEQATVRNEVDETARARDDDF